MIIGTRLYIAFLTTPLKNPSILRHALRGNREQQMLVKFGAAMAAICLVSSGALAQAAAKPTDPQIAHIAYTAGEIDIAAAKQALKKTKNREIKAFAQDMVRDCSSSDTLRLIRLFEKRGSGSSGVRV